MTTTCPYLEGRAAYWAGLSAFAYPYPLNVRAGEEWMQGYRSAEDEGRADATTTIEAAGVTTGGE